SVGLLRDAVVVAAERLAGHRLPQLVGKSGHEERPNECEVATACLSRQLAKGPPLETRRERPEKVGLRMDLKLQDRNAAAILVANRVDEGEVALGHEPAPMPDVGGHLAPPIPEQLQVPRVKPLASCEVPPAVPAGVVRSHLAPIAADRGLEPMDE